MAMRPWMTEAEVELFDNLLRHADHYVEFGSGGSTVAACHAVGKSVASVDSSTDWLNNVSKACIDEGCRLQPRLTYADIGPVGNWGYPCDNTTRARWKDYHECLWQDTETLEADFYFIDGRFRVACFMQAILHSRTDTIIAIHDFPEREYYQVVHDVARKIALTKELAVFVPKSLSMRKTAARILEQHLYDQR